MTGDEPHGLPSLRNHLDVFRAVERVEQLTGCLEETAEESELIRIVDALDDWLAANPYVE